MNIKKYKYTYKGPVFCFDNCYSRLWEAETFAISKEKAIANFKFRFRKMYGLESNTKLDLPGKIEGGK